MNNANNPTATPFYSDIPRDKHDKPDKVALESQVEHRKRADPMSKWHAKGNPRAWNPKAPRLSSSEGARGVTERGLGECMFDNTVAQN